MRLVLYTGKGGVGKTTIAAATAVRAAERGCRTLVVSADAAHSLGDVLDRRLGPAPLELAPHLHALEIDARAELERHWGSIRSFLVSLFVHQGLEAVVAVEPDLVVHTCDQTLPTGVDRIDADSNATANIDYNDERVDVDIAIIDTGIDEDHPDLYVVGGRHFYTANTGPPTKSISSPDRPISIIKLSRVKMRP